jgi:hypothetical protein
MKYYHQAELFDCFTTLPFGHITVDKRLRSASSKLPSAISFIRMPLGETAE